MRSKQIQAIKSLPIRQKVTIVVVALVLIILIWQVYSLFKTPSAPTITANNATTKTTTPPPVQAPKPAQIAKQETASAQNALDLIKLQQETQVKYIEALNELQILKLQRDIAQTNQAITSAKLATVTAEKSIVNLLAPPPPPPPPPTVFRNLANQTPVAPPTPSIQTTPTANYTVISVSQLQGRWNAVLGYQGSLYSVHVGDILPADGSAVTSINKSGVMLRKSGVSKRISLVPII